MKKVCTEAQKTGFELRFLCMTKGGHDAIGPRSAHTFVLSTAVCRVDQAGFDQVLLGVAGRCERKESGGNDFHRIHRFASRRTRHSLNRSTDAPLELAGMAFGR